MENGHRYDELRSFVLSVCRQADEDLKTATSQFINQLFVFSQMSYGGKEYFYQLEVLQNLAKKLVLLSTKHGHIELPAMVAILADAEMKNEALLDWTKKSYIKVQDFVGSLK